MYAPNVLFTQPYVHAPSSPGGLLPYPQDSHTQSPESARGTVVTHERHMLLFFSFSAIWNLFVSGPTNYSVPNNDGQERCTRDLRSGPNHVTCTYFLI